MNSKVMWLLALYLSIEFFSCTPPVAKKLDPSPFLQLTPTSLTQTLDVCIEKLVQCRVDNYSLTEMCIADQTSLREFETCPGYNDFVRNCQNPE